MAVLGQLPNVQRRLGAIAGSVSSGDNATQRGPTNIGRGRHAPCRLFSVMETPEISLKRTLSHGLGTGSIASVIMQAHATAYHAMGYTLGGSGIEDVPGNKRLTVERVKGIV